MRRRQFVTVGLTILWSTAIVCASQVAGSPPAQQHQQSQTQAQEKKGQPGDEHLAGVNRHGDMAMGFSHMKTTHHFALSASGGSIQVQANDPKDSASRDQIRTHLQHMSNAFKDGDFSSPMMTHSRVPPGAPTMKRLKSDVNYKYEETETGGKVLISTANPEALKAVHQFLRFQIDDHQTGDPKTVQK
jgi:hypothetical protein